MRAFPRLLLFLGACPARWTRGLTVLWSMMRPLRCNVQSNTTRKSRASEGDAHLIRGVALGARLQKLRRVTAYAW